MPRQRLGKKNNETHNPVTARRIPSTRFSSRPVILRSGSLTLEPKPPAIEPRPGTNEAAAVTVVTIACTSATRAANASDASPWRSVKSKEGSQDGGGGLVSECHGPGIGHRVATYRGDL